MAVAVAENEARAPWWVYVVVCADDTFYVGMTTDVARRVRQHNAGRGARYTRTHGPVSLAASVPCSDRVEAMRLEARLKRLSRPAKARFAAEHAVATP